MNADERQLGDEQHLPSAFLIESGIDDQPSHDENTTLSSTDYFEALYGKLFRGGDCHDTTIQADGHPLAFDVSSGSTPLRSTALSVVNDFDEIESFLTSSDTFPAIQISDMLQPSQYFDELDSTAEKVKIFVDCIPPRVNGSLLSSFFHGLGYSDVVRIDGPKFKNKNTKASYAFVTFASPTNVIKIFDDYNRTPEKFILDQSQLQLRESRRQAKLTSEIPVADHPREADPGVRTFELTSSMYGTLMGTTAMKNLIDQQWQNATTSASQYGFMVHQRFDTSSTSCWLTIDTKHRTFRIDMIVGTSTTKLSESKEHFRFEWNFRDLKGNKFLPVLTHELCSSNKTASPRSTGPSMYILCEIRRPPCISCVRTRISNSNRIEDEIRLSGSSLIGRANAWLIRIGPEPKIHADFASLLVQHRLCAKGWKVSSAIDQYAERLTVHIDLLLMKEWREKYRVIIDRFLFKRWPSFPFETKFEIMKLISKYIITIYDLIVDERLEFILGKMSAKTLVACVDKITEFAHRWQPTSEKSNGEDWNDDADDEDDPPRIESCEGSPSLCSPTDKLSHTVSPTSFSIDLVPSESKDLSDSSYSHIGSLGRLLCLGLFELRRKHQLNQIGSGIYVTKQEIRAVKVNDMSSLRKVFITPSAMHYEGPHVEEACAVIRNFSHLQDCFLRVSFRDEDYSKLKDINNSMDILYKRICSSLTDSIMICGRKYRFLAFSSSQLREHSCWMFHQRATSNVSCDRIREWMGDFRNIHPVAKVAARLGQSFSTTIKGRELSKDAFIEIPDVTSPMDSQALYTDGIGIIASLFADELAQQMGLPSTPSAFQIRFAGYKGMLCVSLENTIHNNPNIRAAFRPSMKKFDSDNYSIDIVRSSDFSLSFLNRQIILLLSSRRIHDSVFHQIQNEMLDKVMTMNDSAECAMDTLWKFNGSSTGNGTHCMMNNYLSRFHLNTEPFVQQLLVAFQAFQLKELRTKARILIEKGCVLFGVADESRTLEHEEVFIQIHRRELNETRIIEGPVIVTRNPCLHPGDIRRYEAVDNPRLHKLKNVIVFPMDGPRSMTTELAGGDLDGDTFWISWDSRLIFPGNYEAFCYSDQARQAKEATANACKTSYTIDDVCHFFAQYIKADNLGIIATWHMALADRYGAEDNRCLSLASKHSIAVDFVKTGHRPPPLTRDLQPNTYPRFMERGDKKLQQSASILEQLYDVAKKYKVNAEQYNQSNQKSFPYASLIIDGYLTYTEEARILKEEYDHELKRIMRQYGLTRESEIVSGYITKLMSKQYAKDGKTFELRNEITSAVRSLRHRYIRLFWRKFYQLPQENEESDPLVWQKAAKQLTWHNQLELAGFYQKHCDGIEHKASAWFYVTYKDELNNHQPTTNQNDRLYSFPWLVYPILLHIYDRHCEDDETDLTILVTKRRKKNRRRRSERRKRQRT